MAKKRKATKPTGQPTAAQPDSRFDIEDRFEDSEDEFFAGRDKILLDEEPAAKRRRRIEDQEKELQSSDEEVYQDPDSDDESDDPGHVNGQDEEDEEEDEEVWGTSKADYYNADAIETEADALEEEAEARRLQEKQLKQMTDADFGFDESAWVEAGDSAQERRPAIEKLPELQIPANATAEERLQIFRYRYPEFEPLTNDFLQLQDKCQELKKEMAALSTQDKQTGQQAVTVTKFRALSAYLGAIAIYLTLLTSSKSGTALAPGELRGHPVMANLVRCRELWRDAEVLRAVEVPDVETVATVVVDNVKSRRKASLPAAEEKAAKKATKKATKEKEKKQRKVPEEGENLSMDEIIPTEFDDEKLKKPKRKDLQDLLALSTQGKPAGDDESDFGDEAPLTREEQAEKAQRKKSLRFYTSQIAQKANKRGAASRHAGGDEDIPHKERLRDRQDRLMREAAERGRSDVRGDEALDVNSEDGDDGADQGRHLNDEANEYYDSLVAGAQTKKAAKQAKAEAYAEAARLGAEVHEEEQVGPDGKRRITYAIEKNKGLAPKRKKDVRNPRVKKRKKYDEKMKKLGSIRQVYKGGEGRGGYKGEATGIKTNLVRSVKL
jgi:U3 small nucleolar RNA-associated protein 3